MSGTKIGAAKAVAKILERDPEFYKKIGKQGGASGKGEGYIGGFAHPNANPRLAGHKGGTKSRRTKSLVEVALPDVPKVSFFARIFKWISS